jgi:hypothetical protein
LVEYADGVAYRVLDVQISDAVLTGVVRDLHGRRLPCLVESWQVNLPFRRAPSCSDRPNCWSIRRSRSLYRGPFG